MSTPAHRAFTLAEVLIALAVMLGLLTAVLSITSDVTRSRAQILERAARLRAGSTLIDRLETDLQCASLVHGISGDGQSITIHRLGVDPAAAPGSPLIGQVLVASYRLDEGAGAIVGRRQPAALSTTESTSQATEDVSPAAGDPGVVSGDPPRDAAPSDARPDGIDNDAGDADIAAVQDDLDPFLDDDQQASPDATNSDAEAWFTLMNDVARWRLRYHDGEAWQATFTPGPERPLPRAIEVAVWFRPLPSSSPASLSREDERLPETAISTEHQSDVPGSDADEPFESLRPNPDRVRIITIAAEGGGGGQLREERSRDTADIAPSDSASGDRP